MNNCRLCLQRQADKKGSHLVPHFLLKRVVNVEGKTGRDKELGFTIGELASSSYFGRSVSPRKLEEIYVELSDDEIAKNQNPDVVDNFFCSSCETRLSIIESCYANSLKVFEDKPYHSKIDGPTGILFWASILWRMSISERYEYKLSVIENDLLRVLLDTHLADSREKLLENAASFDFSKSPIGYKLLRCPNYSPGNATFILWHPEFRNPQAILLDEYIVCIDLGNGYGDFETKDFFCLKEEVINAPLNDGVSGEQIFVIDENVFKKVCDGLINELKEIRNKKYSESLDLYWNDKGKGAEMPPRIKEMIFADLYSGVLPLGRSYTFRHLAASISKVLKEKGF